MKQVTTFVGIDAHKKDLFVAMLSGAATAPVTWQLANEPGGGAAPGAEARARGAGARAGLLRSRPVWLRAAAADDDGPRHAATSLPRR